MSNDDLTRPCGGFSFACRLPLIPPMWRVFAFWRPACDLLPNDGREGHLPTLGNTAGKAIGWRFRIQVGLYLPNGEAARAAKYGRNNRGLNGDSPAFPRTAITASQGERWTPARANAGRHPSRSSIELTVCQGEPPDYGTRNFNRMRFEFEATLNQTRIKDDSILTHLDGQPPGRRAFSNRLLDRRGRERGEGLFLLCRSGPFQNFLLWGSGPFQNFPGAGEI